ncbi:MAG: hypothetical protein ACK5AZ_12470 [Bryobacteraceae bacterium]
MPSNLLILPLLAGFLFLRICIYTRYRVQALDGYRLLLAAATVGLCAMTLSRLIVVCLKQTRIGDCVKALWLECSDIPYSGTAAGSVVLACTIALALNGPMWEAWRRAFFRGRLRFLLRRRLTMLNPFLPITQRRWRKALYLVNPESWRAWQRALGRRKQVGLSWATRQQNNHLLVLFEQAARGNRMIAVSLTNRKFYVGYVKLAPSLDPKDTHLALYPVRSGYRDMETLCLEFTTDYDPVREAGSHDPYFTVIPINEIHTANFFDPVDYATYFAKRTRTAKAQ